MHQIYVILDYIRTLLARKPFEFDNKKIMCTKLLRDIMSLEKYHKSITVVQKWMFDVGLAEKYLKADESNNIIICCKESLQPISSLELEFRGKKAVIESKNKLLNILKKTDLNQRLMLIKMKAETEQTQLKLYSVHNALNLMLEVYNLIYSQNKINKIKMDELFVHMKSIEDKLEKRIADFELCVKELDESLAGISKESSKSEKELTIRKGISKHTMLYKIHFENVYVELSKIINFSDQIEEFQPLKTLTQDQISMDLNLTDFHKNFNLANEILLSYMQKNCDTITSMNSLLHHRNVADQTFDSNLKNVEKRIDNVLNNWNVSILILNKLNDQLDELKKKNYSLVVCNQNNDHLKIKCNENINNLENEIHESNIKLSATTENSQQLYDYILSLDSMFHKTYQKNINDVNIAHQELLRDDKQPSKVMFMFNELSTAMNDHSELLVKREEIIADQFEKEKSDLDAIVKEHSIKVIETCNVIKFYKNKMPIHKQFVEQLKDLTTSKEMVKKDLLLTYRGLTLEKLNDEETEYKSYINSYHKQLDEINKEDNNIEKYSKLTELNMIAQIKNLKEKLQFITNANASLEMELNKNKHVRGVLPRMTHNMQFKK